MDRPVTLAGPLALKRETLPYIGRLPAVYILGREAFFSELGIGPHSVSLDYGGRADDDARRRIEQHLPENEVNPLLLGCNRFWIAYCASPVEAYELECYVYHSGKV